MAQGNLTIHKHNEYEFVCWWWETGNAWGHEVRLVKTGKAGGCELGKARVRYYNRTWEKYTFQSAMFSALADYKKSELAKFLEDYKYNNGLKGYDMDNHLEWEKPFPKGVKKQVIEEFEAKPIWEELENYIEEGK